MTLFTKSRRGKLTFLPALAILAAVFILNGVTEPNSLKMFALKGLISTYLALMFLAVAQTIVVFAGDIDLSVGAILGLVNVIVVTIMDSMGGGLSSVLLAIAAGLSVGAACGLLNGLLVVRLRLQAIVATFASSIVFAGCALWVMPVAGVPAPAIFWRAYGAKFLGVPVVFLIAIGLLGLIAYLVRTKLILQILTVGDDQKAAYQSGLPVTAIRIKGYIMCGVFAALAALCITGDTASGDPNVGAAITLNSVAATVLGGTALAGGSGSMLGSVFGALAIGLINSLVFFLGTPSEWQNLAQGLTILVALMIGIFVSRRVQS
ncbi:ABC transporter permease [Celeribacter sp.]|uniref:ABC transporter permease n=1 Tax=Celeribacter sp. TaxID=1890673 RepID=UPI003A90B500